MSEKIKSICFSIPYDDDPMTDEFRVEYENKPYLHDRTIIGIVEIEHVDIITVPINKIDWLINCLNRIKGESNE